MRLKSLHRVLFRPGQRICCALSGGADSTALLLALLEANQEKEALGVVLSAIHVHHGLRGAEADDDEAFVRELCTARGVPLVVHRVNTGERQATHDEGMEEAARELRYAAFREHLRQGHADAVATAHTLDDQAETVLMKLLRGAWTEGLAGISPVVESISSSPTPLIARASTPDLGRIVRPLLEVRRAEVESFLRERKQGWREDSSNQDTSLTRNRVRLQLMPALRGFNPAIDEGLAQVAEIAREEENYWRAEIARVLPGLSLPGKPVRGGGRAVSTGVGERSLALEIERLKAQPPALQRRLVRAAAASLGCRPSADETVKLLGLAGLRAVPGLTARNGARLELAGGLRAERTLRELRLSRAESATIPKKM